MSRTSQASFRRTQEAAQIPVRPNAVRGGDPARETIARRAFEIYLARGATHGHDLEDWLQAERELSSTLN